MKKLDKYMPSPVKAAFGDFGCAGPGPVDYASLRPALDVADGLGRVMNNKKLYFRLLSGFPGPQMTEDIATSVKSGDHTKTQQAAHALKGVCANLGLSELREISLQIEMRAKAGEAAVDLLPALEQAMTASSAAIERLLAAEEA
jgi:hypothetical protein